MDETIRVQQLDRRRDIERMHYKYTETPLSVLGTGE